MTNFGRIASVSASVASVVSTKTDPSAASVVSTPEHQCYTSANLLLNKYGSSLKLSKEQKNPFLNDFIGVAEVCFQGVVKGKLTTPIEQLKEKLKDEKDKIEITDVYVKIFKNMLMVFSGRSGNNMLGRFNFKKFQESRQKLEAQFEKAYESLQAYRGPHAAIIAKTGEEFQQGQSSFVQPFFQTLVGREAWENNKKYWCSDLNNLQMLVGLMLAIAFAILASGATGGAAPVGFAIAAACCGCFTACNYLDRPGTKHDN